MARGRELTESKAIGGNFQVNKYLFFLKKKRFWNIFVA